MSERFIVGSWAPRAQPVLYIKPEQGGVRKCISFRTRHPPAMKGKKCNEFGHP
jgi:hypothetical protein